ncbi:MAG: hypothetical protein LBE31_02745 [Deltaproteobacteria bacterium]|jgi:hypothetical protein|nr:hypothetical protein [Deltaproteobacteria bacterium]
MTRYVQEPSRFSPLAFILVPLVFAIVSSLTAIPYALAIWHNPIIYLGIILPGIWALVICAGSRWSLKICNVQSVLLAGLLAIIGSLVGFLLHWAVFTDLVFNRSFIDFNAKYPNSEVRMTSGVTEPEEIKFYIVNYKDTIKIMNDIADEDGLWTIKDAPVTGLVLKLFWLGEAIVFVAAIFIFTGDYVTTRRKALNNP